ncbi:transporter substrate-binding domain-containing protein [uncultured Campylobacter sp.]|uniref:transporter substrate-binding domain-containing protein n=1 Tax=uncultured Campylobacter sp. TaxID=218934 RepID=UPI002632FD62|nr:transporter substrate-binding domain-containing protein [uncultured Campylobacter sp.]
MKKLLLLLLCLCYSFGADFDEIVQNKFVRIGVSPYMPPFSMQNDNGEFEGFEIGFSKVLIEKIFGKDVEVKFIAVQQSDRSKALREDKVDMIVAAYTRNPKRARVVDFSIPYFSINLSVVTPISANIKKISDLYGKRVLTIENTNSDDYLKKVGKFKIVYCQDNKECYNKLRAKDADAFMHNIVSVATIPLINPDYEISIKQIGQSFMDCVAVQKGSTKLLSKINETIIELGQSGFFKESYNNTFKTFYRGTLDCKYFVLDDIYGMF